MAVSNAYIASLAQIADSVLTWQKIGEVYVGAGGAASISFTNIPAKYKRFWVLTDFYPSGNLGFVAQFNGDTTGGHYGYRVLRGYGAGIVDSQTGSGYALVIDSNGNSTCQAFISNQNGVAKECIALGSGTPYAEFCLSEWSGTALINEIDFYIATGTFLEHSRIALYGCL